MNIYRNFRSCFIVDVKFKNDKTIELTDSSNITYFIDMSNENVVSEFRLWFKNVFQKGIAQSLTIFAYEIKNISECEQEIFILKFLNVNDKKI